MTDINSLNAVAQHRAKLREQVINLPFAYDENVFDGEAVVKRADVLKLLNQN
jgi:hypothetical protein